MTHSHVRQSPFAAGRIPDRLKVRMSGLILLILCFCGCGSSGDPAETTTPVAVRPLNSTDNSLNEHDVETFLQIVRELPDSKAPEFAPLPRATIDDRLPAQTLATAYRREYQRMFDPVEQGSHWRHDRELLKAFAAHGQTPEDFAALMTRLGCAVAANTVSSQYNLTQAAEKADQQLQMIIDRIEEWDRRANDGAADANHIAQRRQPLVDQLRDLVALSEFSRILLSVSDESRAIIANHKQELAAILPATGEIDVFERTLDADAVVVPVNYERP